MHRPGKDAMLKLIEAEREGEQVGGVGVPSNRGHAVAWCGGIVCGSVGEGE